MKAGNAKNQAATPRMLSTYRLLSEGISVMFLCNSLLHLHSRMKKERAKKFLLLAVSIGFVVLLDFAGSLAYGLLIEDMRDRLFVYDREVGFIHQSNVEFEVSWPEAQSGKVVFRTNSIGLREDRATQERPVADCRIVVFGDSHTDGVVNNKDSFPHVAQDILNRSSETPVEVLNAGIGLSCIREHAQLLKRLLRLRPRVAVFTIFVGNDYADILHTAEGPTLYDRWLKHSIILRGLRRLDFSPRMRAERINRYAMWQSMAQAYYFQQHPDSLARASRMHEELFSSVDSICREHEIVPLVLILPTKYQIEPGSAGEDFASIEHLLGFLPERKTDEVVSADLHSILTRLHMPFVDLKERFVAAAGPSHARHLFWQADHHLSEYGHAVAGTVLADTLRGLLRALPASKAN